MFNVASNPSVASPVGAAPASPISMVVNNATTANGQPVFAQVVRDVLNSTTSNGSGQAAPASKATDAAPVEQAPVASPAQNSAPAKAPVTTKQSNKLQPQPSSQSQLGESSNDLAIFQALFTAAQAVSASGLIQNVRSADSSLAKTNSEDGYVAALISTGADEQALQITAQGSVAGQVSSQVQAQVSTAPFSAAPLGPSMTVAGATTPAQGSADSTSVTGGAKPTTLLNATIGTAENAATAAANTAAQAPNIAAAETADLPPLPPQKTGIVAQVSTSSPTLQQGQPLSYVLQHVAALQGTSTGRASVPLVMVDLARTPAESQVSQTGEKTALTSSPAPHILAASTTFAPADAKGTQSTSVGTHPIDATQNTTTATNNHSSSQDDSSDHGGQSASDSSTCNDLSSAAPPAAKNEGSAFSDALSVVSMPKPDAAPALQATSVPAPSVSTPPPPSEASVHPVADPLPSAPAQAQQALPPLQTPDAPAGRFVNAAQLTNAASQSEMRIAMQSDKLGAIELHARVSGGEVGAAILVEKRDAHAALAAELPALREALSEKQLRVGQVVLTQGSLGSTAGDAGANSQHNQRSAAQLAQSTPFWNEARSLSTAAWFVPEQSGIFNAQGRLSVQA